MLGQSNFPRSRLHPVGYAALQRCSCCLRSSAISATFGHFRKHRRAIRQKFYKKILHTLSTNTEKRWKIELFIRCKYNKLYSVHIVWQFSDCILSNSDEKRKVVRLGLIFSQMGHSIYKMYGGYGCKILGGGLAMKIYTYMTGSLHISDVIRLLPVKNRETAPPLGKSV